MEKRRFLRVAVIVALCASAAVPCSFDDTPAFAFRVRPDDPVDKFVDGRIGILDRDFARSHLVVAYRWLSGNPPSDAERAGFLELIGHRLKNDAGGTSQAAAWENARAEARGVKPGSAMYTDRYAGQYVSILNCTDDAFLKAIDVLRDRAKRYGAQSAALTSWLDAQEIVFSNCSGDGVAIPKPADASLPAILRADRAYQIASANFYAMKYDDARAQFLQIASDAESPWHVTARIVAARALLRKSTVDAKSEELGSYAFVQEPMEQAERDLKAIVADASMSAFHESARQLLRFTAFRLRPEERFKEIAASLATGSKNPRADLDEYTLLLDFLKGDHDDDLTNWIETIQSGADATPQWRATKKTHWLVAALANAKPEDASELLEASAKIAADSVAYPSVAYPMIAYHRARLLLATNKPDAARAELDRVLALGEAKLPLGSRNRLLEQRRSVARSLADYLRDAQLMPVGNDVEQTPETYRYPFLPTDASETINGAMPLDTIAEAAMTKELPKSIRNPILVAAWTRAILLDRDDVAKKLAPDIISIAPAIETKFNAWLKSDKDQRRFAAADLIVHFGALTPNVPWLGGRLVDDPDLESVYHGAGNWWCISRTEGTRAVPPFLADSAISKSAATEQLALLNLGAGTSWMLQTLLDLADASPKDPRVPEDLSLIVKGVRWSCGDGDTDRLAEQAFNTLRKRYPGTKWAKETPYWYRSGF
jgi:hypothetical protein